MRRLSLCIPMAVLACVALAQEFEVVSVKPDKSGANGFRSHRDQGLYTATNISLKNLIVAGYGMKDYQVEGPDWLDAEHFDVAAKFPEALPRDPEKYGAALAAMMRSMLADRFKLVVRHEQKMFSVYGLTVEKRGIKFTEVPAGATLSNSDGNHYQGSGITMAKFAEFLSRRVDLPVIDMTGLKGFYNLTLEWVAEPRQTGDTAAVTGRATGAALPEAIQEQLGLKIETRRAPLEILIVEQVERVPTQN